MKKIVRLLRKFNLINQHQHVFTIKLNADELWIECDCGHQEDVPNERLEEAYRKIRNMDYSWEV